MAEKTREKRAEARERRRSLMSKPFEQLDDAAGQQDEESTQLAAAKRTAATAAAAALAGALAGAAKAALDRRSAENEAQVEGGADAQRDEAEEHDGEDAEQEERDQDAPTAEADNGDTDDEAAQQPEAQGEPDEQETTVDEDDQRDQPAAEHSDNGAQGASASDAAEVVKQARKHLKELLGADAESVSGLQRANGNWSVTLEVVEMRRVPDSTDVLSSYDVVLDDDGGVVSLRRGRRYRRSQVEEG